MSDEENNKTTLQERILRTLPRLLQRELQRTSGMEQMMIAEAFRRFYPRLEMRIRAASEDSLRDELLHFQSLIQDLLQEETPKPTEPKKRPRAKQQRKTGRR